MKKNILILGIMSLISILLLSPRTRKSICKAVDGEALDKVYEMKNVLSDWRKNQRDTSFE